MTLDSNPSNRRDYTYSYSGADCRAYAWFPSQVNNQPVLLNSMATISISVHEAKSPVRRLGHRGVSGFTEAIRTIAGSIVFTVIEDHPLKHLIEKNNYNTHAKSLDDNRRKLTSTVTLDPINILLKYQTEVDGLSDNTVQIHNLRFINEGVVSSVNDMVTEMVCQFVAEDVEVFEMDWSYEKHEKAAAAAYISNNINAAKEGIVNFYEESGKVLRNVGNNINQIYTENMNTNPNVSEASVDVLKEIPLAEATNLLKSAAKLHQQEEIKNNNFYNALNASIPYGINYGQLLSPLAPQQSTNLFTNESNK